MTMVYRWLKGDFGAFSGSVEFSPGLNTVIAGNESGKSTLSAMIRAMLYGVNTAERERADKLPDKHKYQPWSGRPMGGRLCLTHGGRDIVLSRSSLHGPMKDFSASVRQTPRPMPSGKRQVPTLPRRRKRPSTMPRTRSPSLRWR